MKKIIISFILLLFILCFNVYAKDMNIEYRWEIILNGENEYKSVVLEKEIYKNKLYKLKNLRIIDKEGTETPYFVTNLDNTIKEVFEPEYTITQEDKKTIITIKKEEISNLKINKITLVTNDIFERNVHSEYFNTTLYNFDFPDKKDKKLDIEMKGDSVNNDLIFHIDNNDDIPLNIETIKIEYIKQMLVFKAKPNNRYYIILSTKELECPKYDISNLNFKKYIMNTPLDSCTIGEMSKMKVEQQASANYEGEIVFNLLVSTVSLIMLGIIILNLKRKKEK